MTVVCMSPVELGTARAAHAGFINSKTALFCCQDDGFQQHGLLRKSLCDEFGAGLVHQELGMRERVGQTRSHDRCGAAVVVMDFHRAF